MCITSQAVSLSPPPTHTFGGDPGFCWSLAPMRQQAAQSGDPQPLQTQPCWHIPLLLPGEADGGRCDGKKKGKEKVNKT